MITLPRLWLQTFLPVCAFTTGILGCASPEPPPGTPLDVAPEILTESRAIEPPSSLAGNRLLSGWWPVTKNGRTFYVNAGERARLEIVSIAGTSRSLVLEGETRDVPDGASITITAGDREVGSFPLALPLALDLPADLPTGRVPIDLELTSGASIALGEAWFRGSAPEGSVSVDGSDTLQSGYSLIDYVVHLDEQGAISTTFKPPGDPNPDQRFELWIETEGQKPRRLFMWKPSLWSRLRSSFSVRADLPKGLARLRLVALGEGPAARWTPPVLSQASMKQAESVSLETPAPPRLVLVYVMDALRADHLGHLGGPAEASPKIDQLASEGATLADHYSVAPNTFPSIKSLFLGWTPRFDGGWKVPPDGPTTLAERFQRGGYRTGLFSGNGLASAIYGTDRGFEHVAEEVVMHSLGPGGYSDNGEVVQRSFLDWLDQVPRDEPVFAYLQTLHPHNPYTPPVELERAFTSGIDSTIDGSTRTLRDIVQGRLEPSAADKQRLRALYTASIRYNDDLIAELLEELGRRFEAGEVLFVLTSDHGDELFEHGGVLHGYTLYEEQIRVPVVLWWPGKVTTCRLEAPTDHLDLHYTLRALVDEAGRESWSGRSLWPEIANCRSAVDRSHVRYAAASSVKGGIFMARAGRWKYIWAPRTQGQWGQGGGAGRSRDLESLFDLESDPAEKINRIGDRLLVSDWLRSSVQAWVEADPSRLEAHEAATIDERERERLRALGYLD